MITEFTPLDRLRQQRPLIHCIANQVTAGDCANVVLAAGGSPIMAIAPEEMADLNAASRALVINTGTPEAEKFRVCLQWGQTAAAAGLPIVLDPVGVGASRWRFQSVQAMLHMFTPHILRVNWGEALALVQRTGGEQGVDSSGAASLEDRLAVARALALHRRTVVLLSGPEDIVTDGETAWCVSGGSDLMGRITGTGCMLSCLCGAFAAVADSPLQAALLASAFWKVCARRAEEAAAGRGTGSFRVALMDAASLLTADQLAAEAQLRQL